MFEGVEIDGAVEIHRLCAGEETKTRISTESQDDEKWCLDVVALGGGSINMGVLLGVTVN